MSPDTPPPVPPGSSEALDALHSSLAEMYSNLSRIQSTLRRSIGTRTGRMGSSLAPVVQTLAGGLAGQMAAVQGAANVLATCSPSATHTCYWCVYDPGATAGNEYQAWGGIWDTPPITPPQVLLGGPFATQNEAEECMDAARSKAQQPTAPQQPAQPPGGQQPQGAPCWPSAGPVDFGPCRGQCYPSGVKVDVWRDANQPTGLYPLPHGTPIVQPPDVAAGRITLVGTYDDYGAAYAAHPHDLVPQPECPPTGPPQSPQPPTGPPQPKRQWICAQFKGRQLTVYDYQQYLNQSATEQTVYAGPVRDTREEATADCLLRQLSPPTPPSHEFPAFPRWCSADACANLDKLKQYFAQWASDNRNKSLDSDGHIIQGSTLDTNLGSVPVIGSLLKTLINWAGPILLKAGSDYGAQLTVGLSALVIRGIAGFVEHWTHIGLRDIHQTADYYLNWISPTEIPSAPECDDALIKGIIDDDTWKCYVSANNICPDPRRLMIQARYRRPTWEEGEELFRRGAIDAKRRDRYYRTDDIVDTEDVEAFRTIYDELPTIADHLHWLTRNVDDDDYVRKYHLMDGFSTDAVISQLPGMEGYVSQYNTSGRDFWKHYGKDLIAQGMKIEYAAAHYAAHWINPAPGQLLDMAYRLRPGKPGVRNPFTLDDYQRILAEQDIGPYFQPRFAEIAYHVPALSYLRDMYRQYLLTDEEMQSYHQDLGYSEKDSHLFVSIDKVIRERMRTSGYHGWTPAALAGAYSIRAIPRAKVYTEMERQGWTNDEANDLMDRADAEMERSVFMRARSRALTSTVTYVRQAISVGLLSIKDATKALTSAGWPHRYAQSLAEQEGINGSVALVKQVVAAIRRAFLRGDVDEMGARNALLSANLQGDAIDQYLLIWRLQMTTRHKTRTAAQITADVAAGRMSTEEAIARLTNLGYNDADTRLYLADAEGKAARADATAQKAAQRQTAADARAVAKAARDAERQAAQLKATARRLEPPGKLQRWLANGLIDLRRFNQRMKSYGYDDTEIALYAEEALHKAAGRPPKVAAPGKPARPPKPLKPTLGVLRRWVKEGLIGKDYFTLAINAMGVTGDDAVRYWEDACAQKNAACLDTTPAPGGQPGG